MADWYTPEWHPDTKVITSEKGFTTNEIAIEFLRHYIAHSNAGPHAEWKLLLMDNHGSHDTPAFLELALENKILPYPLIPHLTHCMQPLDVGIFQPYKHWHDVAIKEALASLDTEYGLRSFLRDLNWVREPTFKKSTIRSAFRKSGMWPPNSKECLSQLKTFNPPKEQEDPYSLPALPRTPQKAMEVEASIGKWEEKVEELISSPSRPEWHSFCKGTRQVLTHSQLQESELLVHQKRRQEDLERKVNKRRVVHRNDGPITGREVAARIADIKRKEDEKVAREQAKTMKKFLSIEKKAKYKEGVEARKQERARIKEVKELTKAKQAP